MGLWDVPPCYIGSMHVVLFGLYIPRIWPGQPVMRVVGCAANCWLRSIDGAAHWTVEYLAWLAVEL